MQVVSHPSICLVGHSHNLWVFKLHSSHGTSRMALQARFPTSDLVALLALVPPTETLSKSLVAAGRGWIFVGDFLGEVCVDVFFFLNKDIGAYPAKRGAIVLGFFQIPTQCSPQLKNFEQPTLSILSKCWGRGNELQVYSSGCVLRKNCSALFAEAARPRDLEEDTGDNLCCKPMVCWILTHPEK